jgi:hypothetical protein
LDFGITIAIVDAADPVKHPQAQSGAMFAIFVFSLVIEALSVFRSLPFGLSGLVAFAAALAAVLPAGGYTTVRRVTI